MHTPSDSQVLLNLVVLWGDRDFRAALDLYTRSSGSEAPALQNFAASQSEVILMAPLLHTEIIGMTGVSSGFDALCDKIGLVSTARMPIYQEMIEQGHYPDEPGWVFDAAAQRVITYTRNRFQSLTNQVVPQGIRSPTPT